MVLLPTLISGVLLPDGETLLLEPRARWGAYEYGTNSMGVVVGSHVGSSKTRQRHGSGCGYGVGRTDASLPALTGPGAAAGAVDSDGQSPQV